MLYSFILFLHGIKDDTITDGREYYYRDASSSVLLRFADRRVGVELSEDLHYFHPVGFGDTACLLVFEATVLTRVRDALAMIERARADFVHLREQTRRELLLTSGEAVA